MGSSCGFHTKAYHTGYTYVKAAQTGWRSMERPHSRKSLPLAINGLHRRFRFPRFLRIGSADKERKHAWDEVTTKLWSL